MPERTDALPLAALHVERDILGACFRSRDSLAKCLDGLTPADFSIESHRRIFEAMGSLAANGIQVDRVVVAQYFAARGELQSVGGLAGITDLDDGLLSFNVEWIKILRDHTSLRKLRLLGQDLINRTESGADSASEIIDSVAADVFNLSRKTDVTSPVSIAEFMDDFPGGINELLTPHTKNQGRLFGFTKLDEMTDGIHDSEMLVVSAPPGTGKTAWMLQVAKTFARREDPVAIFSLEMPKRALFNRMCCSTAEVSVNRFRRGDLNDYERQQILESAAELHDLPIHIDDTTGLQVSKLAMRLERMLTKHNIRLCIIDFLQCMSSSSSRHNISERMGEILYGLQQLRKDTGVPMLAMSQMRREPQQARKAPTLADAFGGAAIEHTTDMLGFLWREEISSPEKKEVRGLCDLFLRKNREGEVGTIKMRFIGWKQLFEEIP